MTRQEFQDLLDRYFNGEASAYEEQLVENFYAKLQETEDGWNAFGADKKAELGPKIYEAIQQKKRKANRVHSFKRNKLVYGVAASVVMLLAIGAIFYFNQPGPQVNYVTKSTQSGQKATIRLSDGSTVRLNSKSSITYPEAFAKEVREIELEGEAFFEVKEDKNRPFIVTSHSLRTTVLGTAFNIHAYDPDAISVALVSGKVRVNSIGGHSGQIQPEVFLLPGESALYNGETKVIVTQPFDRKRLVAWKDGIIYLSNANHNKVFDQLAHWYGVEFELVNSPNEKWDYSGEFQDMSLEVVLNTIGFSEGFEFQILEDIVRIEFEK